MLNMRLALGKRDLMHACLVSFQISLCSQSWTLLSALIGIFALKRLTLNEKYHTSGKCRPLLACKDCTGLSVTILQARALRSVVLKRVLFNYSTILLLLHKQMTPTWRWPQLMSRGPSELPWWVSTPVRAERRSHPDMWLTCSTTKHRGHTFRYGGGHLLTCYHSDTQFDTFVFR